MMHEYDDQVMAIRVRAVVTDEHRLELIVPDTVPPGEVEIIILAPQQSKVQTEAAGGLDPDVKRALQFFQTIQRRAAELPHKVQEPAALDARRAEDVRAKH